MVLIISDEEEGTHEVKPEVLAECVKCHRVTIDPIKKENEYVCHDCS